MTENQKNAILIRNYQASDFAEYCRLFDEAGKQDQSGRYVSPVDLKTEFSRPGFDAHKNLFLALAGDRIKGCLAVIPESRSNLVLLECLVHPDSRGRGIASKLLTRAMTFIRESGADLVRINVAGSNQRARRILSALKFNNVRQYHELRLELYNTWSPDVKGSPLDCRTLARGEEALLVEIQNRAFNGSWGFNPNTVGDIQYRLSLSDTSHADVFLCSQNGELCGYCWTALNRAENKALGTKSGRIYMVGVDPRLRGKDIGRQVLSTGLAHLKEIGLELAVLTVDSENLAARALYDSIGFERYARTLWFEKEVSA